MPNSNKLSSASPSDLSRFLARWLQAQPERAALLEEVSQLSFTNARFAYFLQKELSAGTGLPGAMRRLRNLVLCTLIQRDLRGQADMHEVVDTISHFADFVVRTHVADISAELQALYGVPVGDDSGEEQQMIVLGMGKLGGYELNVSSDIDLIFCYPEDGDTRTTESGQKSISNHEFFTRLGRRLIGAISEITADGYSFRVDMALRPNGQSGPLVASFGMVEEYFLIQGREWERYAWVKARAMTGKESDIRQLESIVRPFVYRRYLDFGAIDSLRSMHAQIRAEVLRQETRHPERNLNIKLGRGGIREVEFLAQVFQIIRGGRDAGLRDRSTRNTLRALAERGIFNDDTVTRLLDSYCFLRNLEHRLQYLDDAQTHTFPIADEDKLRVARMMGYDDVGTLLQALQAHRDFVAHQFDTIFGEKDSGCDTAEARLAALSSALQAGAEEEALVAVMEQAGMQDASETARRLRATWSSPRLQTISESSQQKLLQLVSGAIQLTVSHARQQVPCWNRLLDFMEAIARRSAYLSLLTEFPHTLDRLVRIMDASEWAAKFLTRHPLLLDELLDERVLRQRPDWPQFRTELQTALQQHPGDVERQLEVLRELHHALQFRLLTQDLEGQWTVEQLADELSLLADILVEATIQAAWQTIATRHRDVPRFAVIAYGKLGGKELSYASDLDVIFLYDDDDQEAPGNYAKLAQRFITWMTSHTPSGILFDIDVALRPDGASGLLVSSVASFERYQQQSAWLWEHQALTRARFCAGDSEIGARFEAIREQVLSTPRDEHHLRQEVLNMRQRMRDANPPHEGVFDLKHDAGGMIDVEFMVQYLVLRYAASVPALRRNTGNIALLRFAGEAGLIPADQAAACASAYRSMRKLQHRIRLQGTERARVAPELIAAEAEAAGGLWQTLFGNDQAVV